MSSQFKMHSLDVSIPNMCVATIYNLIAYHIASVINVYEVHMMYRRLYNLMTFCIFRPNTRTLATSQLIPRPPIESLRKLLYVYIYIIRNTYMCSKRGILQQTAKTSWTPYTLLDKHDPKHLYIQKQKCQWQHLFRLKFDEFWTMFILLWF